MQLIMDLRPIAPEPAPTFRTSADISETEETISTIPDTTEQDARSMGADTTAMVATVVGIIRAMVAGIIRALVAGVAGTIRVLTEELFVVELSGVQSAELSVARRVLFLAATSALLWELTTNATQEHADQIVL